MLNSQERLADYLSYLLALAIGSKTNAETSCDQSPRDALQIEITATRPGFRSVAAVAAGLHPAAHRALAGRADRACHPDV